MANVYWTGGAPATFDVWDITLANTWAANDIARITIGNKDLLITVGSSTLATIATEIIASVNATDYETPAPPANFSRNVGGQQIPEFTEITAEAHPTNTAIVRIIANTAGVPIGLTAGETTAGDGTFTASNTTVATGPNHIDDPDNYLGGSLPVDNDILYFDRGSVSALYGLTYFRANNIDLNVYITTDWTGQLGLEPDNENGYGEYRQRYFQHRGVSKTFNIIPGVNGNTSAGSLRIDFQDQTAVPILISSARGTGTAPSIFIVGADSATFTNTLRIEAGSVAIEPSESPVTTKFAAFGTIDIGVPGGSSTSPTVVFGSACLLYTGSTMTIYSGSVVTNACTDDGSTQRTISLRGGTLETRGPDLDYSTIVVYQGATLYPVAVVTYSRIDVYGGTVDCRRATGYGATVGSTPILNIYADSAVYDPAGVFTAVIDLVGCKLSQVTLDLPPSRKFDFSASASA